MELSLFALVIPFLVLVNSRSHVSSLNCGLYYADYTGLPVSPYLFQAVQLFLVAIVGAIFFVDDLIV